MVFVTDRDFAGIRIEKTRDVEGRQCTIAFVAAQSSILLRESFICSLAVPHFFAWLRHEGRAKLRLRNRDEQRRVERCCVPIGTSRAMQLAAARARDQFGVVGAIDDRPYDRFENGAADSTSEGYAIVRRCTLEWIDAAPALNVRFCATERSGKPSGSES